MITLSHYPSPLGQITIAGEESALVGLWFDGQRYFGRGLPTDAMLGECEATRSAKLWLECYFDGSRPDETPLLAFHGTDFQLKVWNQLKQVSYGKVITYSELASCIGCQSARAVGNAVGHNPISLIIPCHRVVGKRGDLSGYAGGIDRKKWLLNWEKKPPLRGSFG